MVFYPVLRCWSRCYTTLIILILFRNSLAVKLLLLMCLGAADWADLHLAARFLMLMGGWEGEAFLQPFTFHFMAN